jgi:adenosylhomocysteine nucleosidase
VTFVVAVKTIRRRRATALAIACMLVWGGVAEARRPRRAPLCDTAKTSKAKAPVIVVLSAFPAELALLANAAQVEETTVVDGRSYYVGTLDGIRVVLGLTGIGLVNADTVARAVLDNFRVAAILFNGVAGSTHRIAEVVVADDWVLRDGPEMFAVNEALAALAVRAKTALPMPLEKCTLVTRIDEVVCMPFTPEVILGGHGMSDDPYDGAAPCLPGGDDILGCDLPPIGAAVTAAGTVVPDVVDMETAAVIAVTSERNVPFLAMRSVSDGAGDPQGDRGFPLQFFDYYRLAANNAGIVTRAVLGQVAALAADRHQRRTCRLLARRQWSRAAERIAAP